MAGSTSGYMDELNRVVDTALNQAVRASQNVYEIVRERPTTLLVAALAAQAIVPRPLIVPAENLDTSEPKTTAYESTVDQTQLSTLPANPEDMIVAIKTGGVGHTLKLATFTIKPGILDLPVGAECKQNFYTVHDGDTHKAIAARCGIAWNTYWSWNRNKFKDPNLLHTGETVYLKDPAAIYGPPVQAPKPEAVVPAGYYKIQRGDSFSKISSQFGIPLTKLIETNCLRPSLVAHTDELVRVDGQPASWCTAELLQQRKNEWAALKTLSTPPPPQTTQAPPPPPTTQPPAPETTLPPETTPQPPTEPSTTTTIATTTTTQTPVTTASEPFKVIIVTDEQAPADGGLTATYDPGDLARSVSRLSNTPLGILPPIAPPEAPAQPTEPAPVATPVAPTITTTVKTERRSSSTTASDDTEIPYIPPTDPVLSPEAPVTVDQVQASATAAENAAAVAGGQALDSVLRPERITYTLEHNNKLNQEINVTPEGYAAFLKSIDTSHAGFFNDISGTKRIIPTTTVQHWTGGLCGSDALRCATMMKGRGLSVQFFLMQDGSLHLFAQTPDTLTYHAKGVNSFSIGTEIEARGLTDFNAQQMETYIYLNQYLQDTYHIPLDRDHRIGHSEAWKYGSDVQGRKVDPPPETVDMVFAHMAKLSALMDYQRGDSNVIPLTPSTNIPDANFDTPVQEEEPEYVDVDNWFITPASTEQNTFEATAQTVPLQNDPFASLLTPTTPAANAQNPTSVVEDTPPVVQPTEVVQAPQTEAPVIGPGGPLQVDQMSSYPKLQAATQTLLSDYKPGKPFDWSSYYEQTKNSQMSIKDLASLLQQHGASGDMLVDLVSAAILETGGKQEILGVKDARDPKGEIVDNSSQPVARLSVSAWQHNVILDSPEAWQEAERLIADPGYAAQKAVEKYEQRGLQPWRAADDTVELNQVRDEVRKELGL